MVGGMKEQCESNEGALKKPNDWSDLAGDGEMGGATREGCAAAKP